MLLFSLIFILVLAQVSSQNIITSVVKCENTEFKAKCENSSSPYTKATYILYAKKSQDAKYMNYFLASDLFAVQSVLLRAYGLCKLVVDFEKIIKGSIENSIFLAPYTTDEFDNESSNNNFKASICKIKGNISVLSFDSIFEYFNINKTNFENTTSLTNKMHLESFSLPNNSNSLFTMQFADSNGSIKIKSFFSAEDIFQKSVPRIMMGQNITLFNFVLKNHSYSNKFSMFGLNLISFTSEEDGYNRVFEQYFSDIETPGIFSSYIINPLSNVFSLFWLNAAYTVEEKSRVSQIPAKTEALSDTKDADGCKNVKTSTKKSYLAVMLGFPEMHMSCVKISFVSLGSDTYYSVNKYVDFSFTYGFSTYFSVQTPWNIVFIVISVCLASLAAGLIMFLTSLAIRKSKQRPKYCEISVTDSASFIHTESVDSLIAK